MEPISWLELDELRISTLHVPFGPKQELEKMLSISITARRTFPGGQEPASIPMPFVLVPPRLLPDVLLLLQQRVAEEFPGLQGGAEAPATPGDATTH